MGTGTSLRSEPVPFLSGPRKDSAPGPDGAGVLTLAAYEALGGLEEAGQLRGVVEELVHGSKIGLGPTLAPDTKVLDVFVTARGIAYVDLSQEVVAGHSGGSEAERMTIYSVVNTLSTSFPAVKRVQILVEDKPAQTLAGHIDLTRPLPPDMTVLAASELRRSE